MSSVASGAVGGGAPGGLVGGVGALFEGRVGGPREGGGTKGAPGGGHDTLLFNQCYCFEVLQIQIQLLLVHL